MLAFDLELLDGLADFLLPLFGAHPPAPRDFFVPEVALASEVANDVLAQGASPMKQLVQVLGVDLAVSAEIPSLGLRWYGPATRVDVVALQRLQGIEVVRCARQSQSEDSSVPSSVACVAARPSVDAIDVVERPGFQGAGEIVPPGVRAVRGRGAGVEAGIELLEGDAVLLFVTLESRIQCVLHHPFDHVPKGLLFGLGKVVLHNDRGAVAGGAHGRASFSVRVIRQLFNVPVVYEIFVVRVRLSIGPESAFY